MSAKKLCGIYLITCVPNGRRYVGQSVDITQRWNRHKNQCRKGVSPNPIMQSCSDKYGVDSFSFEILEECPLKFLTEKEAYWVHHLGTKYDKGGMNLRDPALSGNTGLPRSSEAIEKFIQSSSEKITAFGKSLTYKEWSDVYGVNSHTIYYRIQSGQTPETAVKTPASRRNKTYFAGTSGSLKELCETLNLDQSVVSLRLSRGWCLTRAILTEKSTPGVAATRFKIPDLYLEPTMP